MGLKAGRVDGGGVIIHNNKEHDKARRVAQRGQKASDERSELVNEVARGLG